MAQLDFGDSRLLASKVLVGALHDAVHSIQSGEYEKTRDLIDALRQLRHHIEYDNFLFGKVDTASSDTGQILLEMRVDVKVIKLLDGVVKKWREFRAQRFVVQDEPVSNGYYDAFFDGALPENWDFENDVLILLGSLPAICAGDIRRRGQKRVIAGEYANPVADLLIFRNSSSGEYFENLEYALGSFEDPLPKRIAVLCPVRNDKIFSDVERISEAAQAWLLTAHVGNKTLMEFGERWVLHAVQNIPVAVRGLRFSAIKMALRGMPAIIVSPGPSLEMNIHELTELSAKVILIAPAQSLRRLKRAGIVPHIVTVVDPMDLTSPEQHHCFAGIEPYDFGCLVALTSCHPNVARIKPEATCLVSVGSMGDKWIASGLDEEPENLTGGSVSVFSLRVAIECGCSQITLVGQDLSYSAGAQYAGEAISASARPAIFEVPGFYGGRVKTPFDYYVYRAQFQLIASECRKSLPTLELLNATEGGVYIDGFEHLELKSVARRLQYVNRAVADGIIFDIYSTCCKYADGHEVGHLARMRALRAEQLLESTRLQLESLRMLLVEAAALPNRRGVVISESDESNQEFGSKLKSILEQISGAEFMASVFSVDLIGLDEKIKREAHPSAVQRSILQFVGTVSIKAAALSAAIETALTDLRCGPKD
jgi:hypothetical protein